jgi:hypothetical protein
MRRGEGAPAISGVERGGAPGGSSAHKPAAVVLAGQLGEEDDGAGWLGRPKAEAQGRFGGGGPKGGKGELAGSGGRRGGPRLGRIQSRARIQKFCQIPKTN